MDEKLTEISLNTSALYFDKKNTMIIYDNIKQLKFKGN